MWVGPSSSFPRLKLKRGREDMEVVFSRAPCFSGNPDWHRGHLYASICLLAVLWHAVICFQRFYKGPHCTSPCYRTLHLTCLLPVTPSSGFAGLLQMILLLESWRNLLSQSISHQGHLTHRKPNHPCISKGWEFSLLH